MAANDTTKVYPGNLARYQQLRAEREKREQESGQIDAALSMAEELAGISYILDGLRYNTKK